MQSRRSRGHDGELEVGVIPRYHTLLDSKLVRGSNENGKHPSPVSPLSPLESANVTQWSSSSQSSGSSPARTVSQVHHKQRQSDEISSHDSDDNLQLALREIEKKLFHDDMEDINDGVDESGGTFSQLLLLESDEGNGNLNGLDLREVIQGMDDPRKLLLLCAEAVSNASLEVAEVMMGRLNQVASIYGTPMERLAAYMVEGLVARLQCSGWGLCRALRCRQPVGRGEVLSAMQVMYEVCPYIKFGYMAGNGAIAEAMRDEARIHIIDFEIAQGTQYISLLQALALRPGGPPALLRITGVGDPAADVAAPGGVEAVGQRLAAVARAVGVPLQFHALPVNAAVLVSGSGGDVVAALERHAGEALAVNFAMQLHHMADESVCEGNPRDRLLRLARGLGPKVVTLVEQEANTNTAPFLARFREAVSYYGAVFESLDVTLPRHSRERVSVEQHCLARDLVNLVACEGAERVERHEVTGKWRARMAMAGFTQCPLSSSVNRIIAGLLSSYCDKYRLREEDGIIYLGWLDRPLVAASAWK